MRNPITSRTASSLAGSLDHPLASRALSFVLAVLALFLVLGDTASAVVWSAETPSPSLPGGSLCPPTPYDVVLATYEAPMGEVQARIDIDAARLPEGSPQDVHVFVTYHEAPMPGFEQRTKTYGWSGMRPISTSLLLPGDGRGLNNVVKVTARVIADPRSLGCGGEVTPGKALTTLEHLCFSHSRMPLDVKPIELLDSPAPLGGVQIHVDFEARKGDLGDPGVTFQAWMNNPVEVEANAPPRLVGQFLDWTPYTRYDVLLPGDGRGVFNVRRAWFKMETPAWYNVLRCTPWIDPGGALSQVESDCFSGKPVAVTYKGGDPAQVALTLEARPSRAGIAATARAYRADGSYVSRSDSIPIPDTQPGLPRTRFVIVGGEQGVEGAISGTVRAQIVDWPALLACQPDMDGVQNPHGITSS